MCKFSLLSWGGYGVAKIWQFPNQCYICLFDSANLVLCLLGNFRTNIPSAWLNVQIQFLILGGGTELPKFGNFRTNATSALLTVQIQFFVCGEYWNAKIWQFPNKYTICLVECANLVSCLWLVLSSQNLAISEHILYLSFSLGGTKMQTYCHFHKNISPAWLNVQIQSLVSGGTKLPKYGYFWTNVTSTLLTMQIQLFVFWG